MFNADIIRDKTENTYRGIFEFEHVHIIACCFAEIRLILHACVERF